MKHYYERKQDFNFIVRFLHQNRYKNLGRILRQRFDSEKKIKIVDIGCGPAKSYSYISELGIDFSYLGIELREDFASLALERYGDRNNFSIVCDSIENHYDLLDDADFIIGLESFEHIPESLVVRVVEAIAKSKFKYLYLTVPNEVGPAILIKNLGSFLMGYMRHKEYSWRETIAAACYDLDSVERHHVAHKGFDWRWLAQTLRQNCRIVEITRSPFKVIPTSFSPSIGFLCKNDNLSAQQ